MSCINKSLLGDLEEPVRLGRARQLITISKDHSIEVHERVTLDFYINDILISDEFLVIPSLSQEVIIGVATLQKWRIKLDFGRAKIDIDPKVENLQLI